MVIGGDHSVTYPWATAVADAYGRGTVGMVHFDAHADTGTDSWGNLASHATPMRRLIESGAIPGRNFVSSACVATGRQRRRSTGCATRGCAGT